jgi:hypothetical protein
MFIEWQMKEYKSRFYSIIQNDSETEEDLEKMK